MLVLRCLFLYFFVNLVYGNVAPTFFRKDYEFNADTQNFYKVHSIPRTWSDAKARCELEGASLFVPDSKQDQDAVVALLQDKLSGYKSWMGIHDLLSEGEFITVDGVPIDDVHHEWNVFEPNNANNNENCVILYKEGKLNDDNCDKKFQFTCKKTRASIEWNVLCDLPDHEYHYNKELGKCYKVHLNTKTWPDAFSICAAEQSYLAVINNQHESDHLKKMIAEVPKDKIKGNHFSGIVHLGIHNRLNEGWTTVQGVKLEDSGFAKWHPGQPDNAGGGEKCGSMFHDGTLNDIACNVICLFICEHDIEPLSSSLGERIKENNTYQHFMADLGDATSESTPFFRKDYIFNADMQNFYKVHTIRKSWPEALYRCKMEGATLLVPESKAEVDAVVKEVNEKIPTFPGMPLGYNTVWIGITDQFSEGDYVTVNGQPIDEVYIDWADGEPNNNGDEDCICLRTSGKMNDSGCKGDGPFVCKKSRATLDWNYICELPDLSYHYAKNVEKCYKLHLTPKTWADAFAVCTAEESYLAVINTVSEAEHLARLFSEAPKPDVTTDRFNPFVALLGFHNKYENGWATVKGELMKGVGYSRWAEGQPNNAGNKRCGSMFLNGTLNVLDCDEAAIFACEHDLKPSKTSSNDNFNDLSWSSF